jgi:hypothetical protein
MVAPLVFASSSAGGPDFCGWLPPAGVLVLLTWVVYGSALVRFEVSTEGINIRGLYGRSIPLMGLDVDRAGAVDLAISPPAAEIPCC